MTKIRITCRAPESPGRCPNVDNYADRCERQTGHAGKCLYGPAPFPTVHGVSAAWEDVHVLAVAADGTEHDITNVEGITWSCRAGEEARATIDFVDVEIDAAAMGPEGDVAIPSNVPRRRHPPPMEHGWEDALGAVPQHLRAGLVRYVTDGVRPGHFLVAVLENDLAEAVARADAVSLVGLPFVVSWLDNYAPATCHGSALRVAVWCKMHATRIGLSTVTAIGGTPSRVTAADVDGFTVGDTIASCWCGRTMVAYGYVPIDGVNHAREVCAPIGADV